MALVLFTFPQGSVIREMSPSGVMLEVPEEHVPKPPPAPLDLSPTASMPVDEAWPDWRWRRLRQAAHLYAESGGQEQALAALCEEEWLREAVWPCCLHRLDRKRYPPGADQEAYNLVVGLADSLDMPMESSQAMCRVPLECCILADEPVVNARIGPMYTEQARRMYEALLFDVRGKLADRDWLAWRVFRPLVGRDAMRPELMLKQTAVVLSNLLDTVQGLSSVPARWRSAPPDWLRLQIRSLKEQSLLTALEDYGMSRDEALSLQARWLLEPLADNPTDERAWQDLAARVSRRERKAEAIPLMDPTGKEPSLPPGPEKRKRQPRRTVPATPEFYRTSLARLQALKGRLG